MDNLECVYQPKQLLTGMVELVVHNSALVPGIKHCTVSAPHLSGSLHSAIGMPSSVQ